MNVEQTNPMQGLTIRKYADQPSIAPSTSVTTSPASVTVEVSNGNVNISKSSATSAKKKSFAVWFCTNPTFMAGAVLAIVAVIALGAGLGAGLRSDTSSSSSTAPVTFTELAVNVNISGPINNTVVSILRCNLASATTVDPSRITVSSWTERNGTVINSETSLAVLNSPISSCGNIDTQAETGSYLQAVNAAIVLPVDPISIGIEMLVDNTDPSESLNTVVDNTYTVLGPENVIVNLVTTDNTSPPILILPSATPSPSTSPSNTPSPSFGAVTMNNWAAKGPSSMKSVGAMTCSNDGSIIFNVADGVYISNDGGNTFSLTTLPTTEPWSDIACDANCTTVAVTSYNGTVYISTDAGNSFNSFGNSSRYTSISLSDDGSKMVAVTDQDQIFVSTDTGVSWSTVGNSLSYKAVTSSGDGQYIFAVGDNTQIQVSSDGGATWNQYGTTADWLSIAASNNGQYVYAGTNTSGLFFSSDYGVTWNITTAPVSNSYSEIACSNDGRRVIVLAINIFISENYFSTYSSFENSREWQGLAVSSDGLNIFSSVYEGSVYVAPAAAASSTSTSTSSASGTPTPSVTASTSRSNTPTPSTSVSNTPTPSTSVSNTPTPSTSVSNTPTPSASVTPTQTPTPSNSPTPSNTPSPSTLPPGATWFQKYAKNEGFAGACISGDGNIMTGLGAKLYTSSDRGTTWPNAPSTPTGQLDACGMNYTGSVIFASLYATGIYKSVDYGASWTLIPNSNNWARAVYFGRTAELVMASSYGGVLITFDGFATKTTLTGGSGNLFSSLDMRGVCGSDDGMKLFAAADGGSLYRSADRGVTWASVASVPSGVRWFRMSCSSTAQYVLVSNYYSPYDLYVSSDYGVTFSKVGSPVSCVNTGLGVAMSADGSTMVAGCSSFYISKDYGVTWIKAGPSANNLETEIGVSYDGSVMAGAKGYNGIWASV